MPYARQDIITWQKGGYYHLYNRGVQKASIFREAKNYIFVLRKIKAYCQKYQLTSIAYCLMPNHYHFLTRQDGDEPAGLLPKSVFNSYTKAYNKRYEHSGTLFEHRFQAKQVQQPKHLTHLCIYIHANPVKDGLVAEPQDWPFSNYLEWLGQREGTLVDRAFIQEFFGSSEKYQQAVSDYLKMRNLPETVRRYLEGLEK